jgi:uncharacterized membrane protein YsdA (DUF1294 family)
VSKTQSRRPERHGPLPTGILEVALTWGAFLFVGYMLLGWHLYLLWVLAGTIATFVAFAYDKSQARRGSRRIPESFLLGLVAAGGVIGGWAGMLWIRHKTLHKRFWAAQWLASAAHLTLGWLVLI